MSSSSGSSSTSSSADERHAFGGAVSFVLPSSFRSESRHLFDRQEMFVETNTGRTLLVHIAEQDQVVAAESAKNVFTQIAKQHGGQCEILLERQLPPGFAPHLGPDCRSHAVVGHQRLNLSNPKSNSESTSRLFLIASRLPQVFKDLIVLLVVPVDGSSQGLGASPESEMAEFRKASGEFTIQKVLQSLEIHDWSVFA